MIYSAVLRLNERREETASESDQNSMSDLQFKYLFYVIRTVRVLKSTYHPTNTFCDVPFMTYIDSYIFWHRCAIQGVITTKVYKPACQYIISLFVQLRYTYYMCI